jgi:hypothetical protein
VRSACLPERILFGTKICGVAGGHSVSQLKHLCRLLFVQDPVRRLELPPPTPGSLMAGKWGKSNNLNFMAVSITGAAVMLKLPLLDSRTVAFE